MSSTRRAWLQHSRSPLSWSPTLALAVALALLPTPGQACKCQESPVATLLRPSWPSSSGLVLTSESIELDCSTTHLCRWRSVSVYSRSQPGEPARVPLRLPFNSHRNLSISFAGNPVDIADRKAEAAAKAALGVHELDDGGVYLWLDDDGRQTTVELEIVGEVYYFGDAEPPDGRWYAPECCHLHALELRHPWVPTYSRRTTWRWGDARAEAVAAAAQTRLELDADRKLEVDFATPKRPPVRPERDGVVEVDASSRTELEWTLTRPARLKGGPFIGFGGALLDANLVRGRLGWEHAEPLPFLFYSAALETDFTTELSLIPAVEISHGRDKLWWVAPCVGFGVGVPVQVLPQLRPGLRTQLSLSWRMFSILGAFDWLSELPSTDSGEPRPTQLRLAIFGQLSF
ncbi:MAG: hypothetical protein R6X02_30045 [Enhygromyxa sp.]